jgi:hypothetical protein
MNGNEQDTEPTLRTIAEMLTAFREETNTRLQSLEERVGNIETRLEQGFEQVRLQMISIEVRMDRLEAMGHQAMAVAKTARADTMILTEEVHALRRDFQGLLRPAI